MTNQNSKSVEAWELTAFALGELDQEHNQRIQTALESNAALAAELSEIQKTIGLVRNTLQAEDLPSVDSTIGIAANPAIQELTTKRASDGSQPDSPSKQDNLRPQSRGSRGKWIALLAMSASLLVVVVYSSGVLNDRLLVGSSSKDSISWRSSEFSVSPEKPIAQLESVSSGEPRTELSEQATGIGASNKNEAQVTVAVREVEELSSQSSVAAPVAAAEVKESGASTFSVEGSNPIRTPLDQDDVVFESLDMYSTNIPRAEVKDMSRAETGKDLGAGGMGMGGMGAGGMGAGGMGGMGMGDSEASISMGSMGGMVPGGEVGLAARGPRLRSSSSVAIEAKVDESRRYDLPSGWNDLSKRRLQPAESNSDRYQAFSENQFELVDKQPLSTFSIDVDTASYAKCRQLLLEAGQTPPASAVRLEEFVNYFDYEYAPPKSEHPFATHLAVSNCPWQADHKLVRIALQSAKPSLEERKPANVVFLIDVSGSMSAANKLPLVKDAMRMMIERLGEKDRVAMVVYAGAAGCVLEGTPGNHQATILAALDRLQAGGSTNGGDGIQLAYQLARDQFIPGGNNRVVLCTDGDFNVGLTGTEQLVELVAQNAKSKIFLTVLGFGMGNTNDAMMEQISNRGNGVYGFVDSWREAKRQMVDQLAGNLITIAKDVKIQIEFNPKHVKAYRLLGYENRMLAAKDFNDDTKDAGEIGAGHRVTAFYEVVPVGVNNGIAAEVDDLLFQPKKNAGRPVTESDEKSSLTDELADSMMAVKLRYKQPEGDVSQKLVVPLANTSVRFQDTDRDFRWAASMVQFGMLLRNSQFAGNSSWSGLLEQAREAAGSRPDAQREEAMQMMERASRMR